VKVDRFDSTMQVQNVVANMAKINHKKGTCKRSNQIPTALSSALTKTNSLCLIGNLRQSSIAKRTKLSKKVKHSESNGIMNVEVKQKMVKESSISKQEIQSCGRML